MAKQKEGFVIKDYDEIKIILPVELQGRTFKVTHIFREPTAEDQKKYRQQIARLDQGSQRSRGNRQIPVSASLFDEQAEAAMVLWDRCIIRVEGYVISEGRDWREALEKYSEHKIVAATELLNCHGLIGETELKN